MNGTIFRWNPKKGIGNIASDDGHIYFFHHSAVAEEGRINFELGEKVDFEPIKTEKGDVAIAIKRKEKGA